MTQSLSCSIEVNIVIMCLLFHPGIKEREREKKTANPKPGVLVLVASVDIAVWTVQLAHSSL